MGKMIRTAAPPSRSTFDVPASCHDHASAKRFADRVIVINCENRESNSHGAPCKMIRHYRRIGRALSAFSSTLAWGRSLSRVFVGTGRATPTSGQCRIN